MRTHLPYPVNIYLGEEKYYGKDDCIPTSCFTLQIKSVSGSFRSGTYPVPFRSFPFLSVPFLLFPVCSFPFLPVPSRSFTFFLILSRYFPIHSYPSISFPSFLVPSRSYPFFVVPSSLFLSPIPYLSVPSCPSLSRPPASESMTNENYKNRLNIFSLLVCLQTIIEVLPKLLKFILFIFLYKIIIIYSEIIFLIKVCPLKGLFNFSWN